MRETKSRTRAKKGAGLLQVELPPVMTHQKFSISEQAVGRLARYAAFMTERMGKEVSPDHVVESLCRTLDDIEEFRKWSEK
jgi:hypothetical protein